VGIGFASELSDIFEKADIENYMLISQPMSAPSTNPFFVALRTIQLDSDQHSASNNTLMQREI